MSAKHSWSLGRKICLLMLGCLMGASRTSAATTQPSDAELLQTLQRLDSDDPEVREQATAHVMMYPLALPTYVAILQRSDTSPEVSTRLGHCVDLLKVGYDARMRLWEKEQITQRWRDRAYRQAYLSIGDHNPKWDDKFLAVLPDVYRNDLKRDQINKDIQLLSDAVAAGCHDPLVRYFLLNRQMLLPMKDADIPPSIAEYESIAKEILSSGYSARVRVVTASNVVSAKIQLEGEAAVARNSVDRALIDAALALIPQVAAEQDVLPSRVSDLTTTLQKNYTSILCDDKQAYDLVEPVLEKSLPGKADPLIMKGCFYTDYAWEARGTGYANSVTNDGWKIMGERLQIARDALEQANQIDSTDTRIGWQMIIVCMGQSTPRSEMETWFNRAMAADPDDIGACRSKMGFLEPKWGGSPEDMLQFGRQLLATENWTGRLPLELVEAHQTLATYSTDKAAYFKDQSVWDDLHSVYVPALEANPDNTHDRSWYAYFACESGHYDIANEQFKILGDDGDLSAFNGKANYDYYRRKAARLATPATQP